MNLMEIKAQWEREGFCIIPGFIDAPGVERLRNICDRVLGQWFEAGEGSDGRVDGTNMAYLTDPVYFKSDQDALVELLELIADEKILRILGFIANSQILFHNTQYFFHPKNRSTRGDWHRDTQFLAPDIELERERMNEATGAHFRIAFLDDDCLEYVPGSEKRWDTVEELAIRKGINGRAPNSDDMPGKRRIELGAGDAALFHAWGIHRGIYDVNKPRRTLDIIYGWGKHCDYFPPPATCFDQPLLLNKLSPGARTFFQHFIETYRSYWAGSE